MSMRSGSRPEGRALGRGGLGALLLSALLLIGCNDKPGEFMCKGSGSTVEPSIIPGEQVCDGVANCHLADDEEDCAGLDNLFCAGDDEKRRKVYSPKQECDGKQDCFFAEDEKGCPDSFLCGSPDGPGVEKVIPRANVCDGTWDCRSDEFNCEGIETFTCSSGRTIPLRNRCDRIKHCTPASPSSDDEEMCGVSQPAM